MMEIYLYTTHHIQSYGSLQFLLWGEKSAWKCTTGSHYPYLIPPIPPQIQPMHGCERSTDHNTGVLSLLSRNSVWVHTVLINSNFISGESVVKTLQDLTMFLRKILKCLFVKSWNEYLYIWIHQIFCNDNNQISFTKISVWGCRTLAIRNLPFLHLIVKRT